MTFGTLVNTAVLVSLTGASAVLLYIMFKKRDDDEARRRGLPKPGHSGHKVNIEVSIPKEAVGIVIGRQGCNIQNIQEKTRTRIKFKDCDKKGAPADSARTCVITGSDESVEFARSLIQDLIRNQPLIMTSEMFVPPQAIARIIGRCGENMHQIVVASGAKVNVEDDSRQRERDKFAPRRIILKGSSDQIAVARSLIEEKVAEEKELRKRYESGAANRSPRKTNKTPGYLTAGESAEAEVEAPHAERLDPMSSDQSLEVYMSAVESPGQFWVQILSPSAAELDQLVQQMTDYYTKPENQDIHRLEEVIVGQLVAATFRDDQKWYRAQVVNVKVNEYEPADSEVELYYMDYGDTYDLEQNAIFELRTDFLKLRPQAIECSLAKIKPLNNEWSDAATDLFEELTFSAQWKVIICKVDHYDPSIQRRQDRGRREGSPVPVVELFNISGQKDINVGEELVKNRFAVHINPPTPAGGKSPKEGKTRSENKTNDAPVAGKSGDEKPSANREPDGASRVESGSGDATSAALNGHSK